MKTSQRVLTLGLALTAGVALAQRRSATPTPTPEEQQAVQQGMEALFKALGGAAQQQPGGQAPGLIEHRELKALLPAAIQGFKRTSASSERTGAMGMTVSRAEAVYKGDKDAELKIEINDLGGMGGIGMLAHAAWASADIDRESDEGFERTAQYKGVKAMEEYRHRARNGKMQVMVGNRIQVSVEGYNVSFEQIRAAMDSINLDKLAALKPAAPEAAK